LATLAAAAGTALVAAMTTSAWQQASSAIARLFGRVHPETAQALTENMEKTRTEALAAHSVDDAEAVSALAADWGQRLGELMEGDPDVAPELESILRKILMPALGRADRQRVGEIIMTANVSGEGRVYQAGRDQWISG
jgi:hypothetical protein